MRDTHEISFDGAMLARGFWLYVWEITLRSGEKRYYVGRTGDNSSTNAQSPFSRLSQHLGANKAANTLTRYLAKVGIAPQDCSRFRVVTNGPLLPETKDRLEHNRSRDCLAALERDLAEMMVAAGYKVLNTVKCRKLSDPERRAHVRQAFAKYFPQL